MPLNIGVVTLFFTKSVFGKLKAKYDNYFLKKNEDANYLREVKLGSGGTNENGSKHTAAVLKPSGTDIHVKEEDLR